MRSYGARSTGEIPGTYVHIVELPPQANEQAVAHALQQLPQVEFAELDELLTPQGLTPNDPMLGYEWHLYAIAAMDAAA